MDKDGIDPEAFAEVCRTQAPKSLYLHRTLQNPTTLIVPEARCEAMVAVPRRHGVPCDEIGQLIRFVTRLVNCPRRGIV